MPYTPIEQEFLPYHIRTWVRPLLAPMMGSAAFVVLLAATGYSLGDQSLDRGSILSIVLACAAGGCAWVMSQLPTPTPIQQLRIVSFVYLLCMTISISLLGRGSEFNQVATLSASGILVISTAFMWGTFRAFFISQLVVMVPPVIAVMLNVHKPSLIFGAMLWTGSSLGLSFVIHHKLLPIYQQNHALALDRWRTSVTDDLTGAANRPYLFRNGDRLLNEGHDLAVMFLDLDTFKEVNDEFGHHEGDQLLVRVAQLLRRGVPDTGIVARIGGDEFCIVLPDATLDEATTLAEHFRSAVLGLSWETVPTMTSIGVSRARPGESFTFAVQRADAALLKAKHSGRNQVVVYRPGLHPLTPLDNVVAG